MYEELDEIIISRNPKGGRPQKLGKMLFERGHVEASQVIEESHVRYLLGYCHCSRKIVIGEKRAQILVQALRKNYVNVEKEKEPLRIRIANLLLKKAPI